MTGKWTAIAGAALVAIAAGIVLAIRAKAGATGDLDTPKKKSSYAMGVAMARNFKTPGVDVDRDLLARGLKDEFSGRGILLAEDDLRAAVSAFQEEQKQKQAETVKRVAEVNRNEGEAFFAQNAKEAGVVTLPSGLQYKVLSTGNGERPKETDIVECRYRATRIDGKEFESSDAHGGPATITVAALIPGWNEALKLMPVGSKWKIFVPSQLAYGERGLPARNGRGTAIEPNQALIFEVELLAIKPHAGPRPEAAVARTPPAGKEN